MPGSKVFFTSGEASRFGAEQMGLPSNVKILKDEHRHRNSTWEMSLTLLLQIKFSTGRL